MIKIWRAKFSFAKSGRREFLTNEFMVTKGENVDDKIKAYLHNQNAGEPKSDRLTYRSKYLLTPSTEKEGKK